jgi:hypothetical protein
MTFQELREKVQGKVESLHWLLEVRGSLVSSPDLVSRALCCRLGSRRGDQAREAGVHGGVSPRMPDRRTRLCQGPFSPFYFRGSKNTLWTIDAIYVLAVKIGVLHSCITAFYLFVYWG